MNNIPAVLNISNDNYIGIIISYLSCIFYIFLLTIMLMIFYIVESLITIINIIVKRNI